MDETSKAETESSERKNKFIVTKKFVKKEHE